MYSYNWAPTSFRCSKKTSYPGSGNTWYDLSGNGNNGTLLNDVVYDISSGSFVFDGVNNNVSLISTFFNNSITDSLSIESWVKASSLSYTVIGGGQDTVGTRYTASLNANVLSSKEFGFDLEAVNGQVRLNSSPNSLKLNVWNHLVGTYNGSEAKFYLNGLLVDTDKRTSGNIVDFDEIILGKDISGGRYFNGNVSTYSIYNKELTSQEIKQNFNALRERYGL